MARRPRKITPEYLDKAALFYLERYASSSENLKTVLRRKVWRSSREHEVDQEQAEVWIGETVTRLQEAGWLDDQAWADMRVRSLRYKGESARSIRMKLAAKGIAIGPDMARQHEPFRLVNEIQKGGPIETHGCSLQRNH